MFNDAPDVPVQRQLLLRRHESPDPPIFFSVCSPPEGLGRRAEGLRGAANHPVTMGKIRGIEKRDQEGYQSWPDGPEKGDLDCFRSVRNISSCIHDLTQKSRSPPDVEAKLKKKMLYETMSLQVKANSQIKDVKTCLLQNFHRIEAPVLGGKWSLILWERLNPHDNTPTWGKVASSSFIIHPECC